MKSTVKTQIVILAVLINSILYGQTSIWFNSGLNLADLSLNPRTPTAAKVFGAAGILVEKELGPQLKLQVNPYLLHKGGIAKAKADRPDIHFDLSYLELPVMVKYEMGEILNSHLCLGTSFGFNLGSKAQTTSQGIRNANPGSRYSADLDNVMQPFDVSLCLGAGIDLLWRGQAITMDVRYTHGLTDLLQDGHINWKSDSDRFTTESTGDDLQSRSLQFLLGIKMG